MPLSATRTLVLIPASIAINIALGSTVQQVLKLPIYLDSVGTVLTGVLAGPIAGLLTGAFALRPPIYDTRLWLRRVYAAALVVLLVFLTATVAVDWSGLQTTQQIIYVALIGLATFMVTRVFLAFQVARQRAGAWESR